MLSFAPLEVLFLGGRDLKKVQNNLPGEILKKKTQAALPPCVPTCVLPSYRLPILCAVAAHIGVHRARPAYVTRRIVLYPLDPCSCLHLSLSVCPHQLCHRNTHPSTTVFLTEVVFHLATILEITLLMSSLECAFQFFSQPLQLCYS